MGSQGSRAEFISAGDPAWDAWLGGAAHDVHHAAAYHRSAPAAGDGTPLMAVVGDRRRGVAWPYLARAVTDGGGPAGADATEVTSVYGYPGPVAWGCVPGERFLTGALSEILRAWRDQGVVAAFTRFHPLLENAALMAGFHGLPGCTPDGGSVVATGLTVSVDCTVGDDAAWAGYTRTLRQHIAAGRRAGLVTVHDEGWQHLGDFVRLYRETMVRSGADERYLLGESEVERMRPELAGHLHLLVSRLGDEVAAAGIMTEYGGIVQSHLVGTNTELLSHSPFKVLLDDVRVWARGRGDRVLHLGGGRGGRQDSLLVFKGEFSPRRHLFHVGRWVLDPDRYRDLVAARSERCPDGHVLDDSFFPRYRAPFVRPAGTPADPDGT